MVRHIKVKLATRSYNVHIENGVLKRAAKIIAAVSRSKNIAILSVRPVFNKYGKAICESLRRRGVRFYTILIPDGERQKNERTLFFVLKKMSQLGLQRNSCLI